MENRLRSLDFLRSIAIILVILAHTVLSYGAPSYLAPLQLGGTGVDLFFVLSGWLLGGQLFKESEKNGNINIKRFWIRRWLRTLPAYYCVLIVLVLQRLLTKENLEFPWQYFLFLQNYDTPLTFFDISWSLAVEEQFYLLIAPLVSFFTLFNKRITSLVLIGLLLIPIMFRSLGFFESTIETHVRLDCCVMGVLLAHVRYQYSALWEFLSRNSFLFSTVTASLYIIYFVLRYVTETDYYDPNKLLLAVIFGSWVILANSSNGIQKKFYIAGSCYIATRSYSLYLLHPETLALLKRIMPNIPFLIYFCVAFLSSIIIAEILYRIIEKPIMDLRENFNFTKSFNSK